MQLIQFLMVPFSLRGNGAWKTAATTTDATALATGANIGIAMPGYWVVLKNHVMPMTKSSTSTNSSGTAKEEKRRRSARENRKRITFSKTTLVPHR